MTYGFTDDGMLATFTNLDNILDPEECLALPKPKGRNINIEYYSNNDELDSLQRGAYVTSTPYKVIPALGDGMKVLKECLADDVKDGDTLFIHISNIGQTV